MPERVALSRSLYSPDAVQAAAKAYEEVAKISLEDSAGDIVVTFSDLGPADAEIVDAFCNHALHETVLRARQGGES